MLRSAAEVRPEEEGDIPKLRPDVLRSKWRQVQILNQKYMSAAIDSTWRQKQVSGPNEQSTFSQLGLGLSESNSSLDDFDISGFGLSEGTPSHLVCGLAACEIIKTECLQPALSSTPCLSGWLTKKKASSISFMTTFSKWKKSWFVVMMESDALILNRYDGDMFSAPTNSMALDLGHKASREPALDGRDRFCFSVSTGDSKARIVLAGDSKAQAENWVATLNSVMAEMDAGDKPTKHLSSN